MVEVLPAVCLLRFFMKSFRFLFLFVVLLSPLPVALAQPTIYEEYAQEAGDALMIILGDARQFTTLFSSMGLFIGNLRNLLREMLSTIRKNMRVFCST